MLAGDDRTLSLSDLTQLTAANRQTCRISVETAQASGELYLVQGRVVHAWLGDLQGAPAAHAMLGAPNVRYRVEEGSTTLFRSLSAEVQELVLEAARLSDEGKTPVPRPIEPPRAPEPPRPSRRVLLVVALCGLAVGGVIAGVGWRWKQGPRVSGPTASAVAAPAPGEPAVPPVEAESLTGPGDAPPRLIEGAPARSPAPELALLPTIVCRVLVDARGRVSEARVYRSRLDLASFEDAALAAVERYRFQPARKAGREVRAWVNWPVRFIAANAPETTVHVKGSDTILGSLGRDLAGLYQASHPGVHIAVESLGSATAFTGLFDGSAELGAASRPASATELAEAQRLGVTLTETVLGYDGVAVIVHPSSPLKELTIAELSRLFSGEAASWKALGGPDRPVHLVGRPAYSGTHAFFLEKVVRKGDPRSPLAFAPTVQAHEKSEEVVRRVAADPDAVGYVGLGYVTAEVRALAVSAQAGKPAIAPSIASVSDGSYPIYRPLLVYTRGTPSGEAAAFLRFLQSDMARDKIGAHGFVAAQPGEAQPAAGPDDAPTAGPDVTRIYFARGSATLDEEARHLLRGTLERLRGQGAKAGKLLVIGHADAEGDEAQNLAVSRARAEHVAAWLTHSGVDAARVEVQAEGDAQPVATNESASGRSHNRRVDVLVGR